uniref:Uncharacterized protein n=1 Tax=Rhipicephalus pulchellus TaxID=72859 RepID=L7LX81_RHIPC
MVNCFLQCLYLFNLIMRGDAFSIFYSTVYVCVFSIAPRGFIYKSCFAKQFFFNLVIRSYTLSSSVVYAHSSVYFYVYSVYVYNSIVHCMFSIDFSTS